MKDLTLQEVIELEREQLRLRRKKLGLADEPKNKENWMGIALSGGGIRSATINMGFLKTLNRFGILRNADYLSTVSGGGYTHSYVQATLKAVGGDYDKLFTETHIDALRQHGEYMIPGRGIWKKFNGLLLIVSFVVSWAMSLVSLLLIGAVVYFLYLSVVGLGLANPLPVLDDATWQVWYNNGLMMVGALLGTHFLANIVFNFNLDISKIFNRIEAVVATVFGFVLLWRYLSQIEIVRNVERADVYQYLLIAAALILAGFLVNPNALSFHRYYRKQLADSFLRFAGPYVNMPLKDMFDATSDDISKFAGPYPIINTCLNLQAPDGDAKFKGSKANDYFILSPLFCGSKLTSYIRTDAYWDYKRMTLPAAVTVSAAAVNPGMGNYSNAVLSVAMTLLNARLGFWTSNPLILGRKYPIVWWPMYFLKELFGRIGTDNRMVNISDGGHIENLGVYELLRRKCRLIIAFDAGADGAYTFADLNNIIIRSRNELGYEIRFKHNQSPEDLIRPRPSQVYSKQRYAVADIYQHWVDEKIKDPETGKMKSVITNFADPVPVGTFVYVKSSVTAPDGKLVLSESDDPLRFGTYKYKIYHPDFPHESTSDQFFDPIQWEAYYQLGQFIGADVLGLKKPEAQSGTVTTMQLVSWFDEGKPLFGSPVVAASTAPAASTAASAPVFAPDSDLESTRAVEVEPESKRREVEPESKSSKMAEPPTVEYRI
jgi:hypothetical protein